MCAICDRRPAAPGGRYCNNCQAKLDKEARRRAAADFADESTHAKSCPLCHRTT